MASSFTWKSDTLFKGFDPERIMAGAHIKMETEAIRIQGQMQSSRPWTDRTGQAKRTLSATVEKKGTTLSMVLAHGVEYGQHLEMKWNQRYAIIKPTITTQAPRVMQAMAGLFSRL